MNTLVARFLASGLVLLMLTSIVANPMVRAEDSDWELKKDKSGVKVYLRKVDGWKIKEIRAVSVIQSSLSSLVAVISDVANSPKLLELVEKAEIRNRQSDSRFKVHSVINLPWPITDREILTQREISQSSDTGVVTIRDVAIKSFELADKSRVPILRSHQTWTLRPMGDGKVHVEIRTLSDPNGPIPGAIINAMSVGTPIRTLSNLRKLASDPAYAETGFDFISDSN